MTRARLYNYISQAFFLGAGVMALVWLYILPEKPIIKERIWLDKPHHTAVIDNVRCYYWHNPHPYTGNKTVKACEIIKR